MQWCEWWRSVPVSPGSRPRPSLSAPFYARRVAQRCGVAGVSAPAFVEREHADLVMHDVPQRVAGVSAPAFVERGCRPQAASVPACVSPGSRPRPSLSESRDGEGAYAHRRCRRGLGPGLR